MNKVIKKLIKLRGLESEEDIEEFFSPQPKRTYDPFLLKDLNTAVELIKKNIDLENIICIFGDYDADGVTATSILKSSLDSISSNIIYYIPSRFNEGYGLNNKAISELKEKGVKLIITVDCGIVATNEVKFARSLGMDVIITDHHTVGEEIPDCLVINPHQKDCNYPFEDLAGCGVAYKLVQGLEKKGIIDRKILHDTLDLVTIGTLADIVPLIDENRTIVKYGIKKITMGNRLGLRVLREKLNQNISNISSQDISFNIVPNINAAGRMDDASIGVELFLTKDPEKADIIAEKLIDLNNMRKEIQKNTYIECTKLIKEQCAGDRFPVLVYKEAHEGVLGIVASNLREEFNRPVAVLSENGDILKGSCRSSGNIDVHSVLNQSSYIFKAFGGHKAACGMTLEKDNLQELRENLRHAMADFTEEDFQDIIKEDLVADKSDMDLQLAKELCRFEPFGKDNEKPLFKLKSCQIQNLTAIGKDQSHHRFYIEIKPMLKLSCIIFNTKKEQQYLLETEDLVDIYGGLEINYWKGNEYLQFVVMEVRK